IDPSLFKSLGGYYREDLSGQKPKSRKLMLPRDFTHNIKIGGEIFEIETIKGKKEVRLPWERLKAVSGQIQKETLPFYKGLRGTIIINDMYTLLRGEKLSLILTLLPSLNPEINLHKTLPITRYDSRENLDKLLEQLPGLVTPALWKKHDRERAGHKKQLGFSGLFTDGEGNYRIRCSKGFHTSLNESIASLETLIDELGDDVDVEKKHIVNQCYRRLSDLLG
ncbi:MAG: ATP-dependent RNA helicase, partial [Treponema sp.]|nr:ATP-dependent RNA helicase [Treponema sp.]